MIRHRNIRLCLTVAAAKGGIIGADGRIPWKLPDEMSRFKALTVGKPVIMGRRTFERDIKKPLKGRFNIVLTRDPGFTAEGVTVAVSLDEGLAMAFAAAEASGADEVHVIGGAEVYAAALPLVDRIYLTEIDAEIAGDTRLPPFDAAQYIETSRETHGPDARHAYGFTMRVLDRKEAP